jgi:MYXO-CTERM domain-containing protein
VLISLLLATAWASPTYPAKVSEDLGTPCVPQCTICHADNGGGSGTVVQDFGVAMMAAGLTGGSQYDLLQTALDTLDSDGTDSDGDGAPDIDALVAGVDPNTGEAFCATDTLTPTYGCIGSAVPAPASALGALAGLLGITSLRRRR